MATAGAMWVMDWNRTSVSPIAFRSRLCGDAGVVIRTSLSTPTAGLRRMHRMHARQQVERGYGADRVGPAKGHQGVT